VATFEIVLAASRVDVDFRGESLGCFKNGSKADIERVDRGRSETSPTLTSINPIVNMTLYCRYVRIHTVCQSRGGYRR
jgi:hypothetical protein